VHSDSDTSAPAISDCTRQGQDTLEAGCVISSKPNAATAKQRLLSQLKYNPVADEPRAHVGSFAHIETVIDSVNCVNAFNQVV